MKDATEPLDSATGTPWAAESLLTLAPVAMDTHSDRASPGEVAL